MTNPDTQQARKWAHDNINGWHFTGSDRALAAARVIQSLPDEWIDAEKLREMINEHLLSYPHGSIGHTVAEDLACKMQALLSPPLPTLADMTPEGREACQWMQADHTDIGRIGITQIEPTGQTMIKQDGAAVWSGLAERKKITPRPDLPRLEWPGSGDAPTIAEQENVAPDQQVNPQVKLDSPLPRPEDVPEGEPWIVLWGGKRWVGVRADIPTRPWSIVRMDGRDIHDVSDSKIALISRLVPERKENA